MTAKTNHARMQGHVLMETTSIHANAILDTLESIVKVRQTNIQLYAIKCTEIIQKNMMSNYIECLRNGVIILYEFAYVSPSEPQ